LRAHFARVDTSEIEDDVFSANLDFDWQISDTTKLTAGAYFISREKDIVAINNVPDQCNFCGFATQLRALNPAAFDAVLGGEGVPLPDIDLANFLSESGSDIPRNFPAIPADLFTTLFEGVQSNGTDQTVTSTPGFNSLTTAVEFQPVESSLIEEDVFSVYFKIDNEGTIAGLPYRGNFGIRFDYTDLTSSGAENQLIAVRPTGGADQQFTFTDATPISSSNDYFDVLPSFNIAVNLTDNLILRGALARTLTRPTLTDLAAASTVTSINIGLEGISSGNPELEATTSNNFDLSLEYYGENLTASAAFFYKDIEDFVSNVTINEAVTLPSSFALGDLAQATDLGPTSIDFDISRPENGDEAEVIGLELAAQYAFDNGFGIGGNITIVDSDATVAGVSSDLENVSDLSYNLFAFYETDRLSTRIALNFREEFLQTTLGQDGLSETVDDFTSLDATFAYDINDNFTVFVEGINLTDEDFFRFADGSSNLIRSFEEFGTRINLGLRGNF